MSDSSEDEDLSKFREAVDNSFIYHINKSKKETDIAINQAPKLKSERYLDISSHYNDVKVPEGLQRQIAAKVSAVINKNVEFVNHENGIKKRKIKGGVKLFKTSEGFLSCEVAKDTYTEEHNKLSKKIKNTKRIVEEDCLDDNDKINAAVVTGEYILSKEETKLWKSRRKEKLFKYKSSKKSKVLTAIE